MKIVSKITCFIVISLACANTATYQSYSGYKVYKIIPKSENEVQILSDLKKENEYSFWTHVVKVMSDVRIMVQPTKQNEFENYLASVNLEYKVAIDDVDKFVTAQMQRPHNRANTDYSWDYYQNLEEIHDWLRNIAETHSDVVTLVDLGTTFGERHILGVEINYRKQDNPTIAMIEGGIHAREWISPATVTWIIKELLTSSDPNVRAMAENIVWHLFPVTNPDGYDYTFTSNRMWRKNRNTQQFTSCGNANDDMSNGVDLNRNFGFLWMTTGASTDPCSEVYAGPVANSENETRAIIGHVNRLRQTGNLVFYITFHSFAQMVLVPYSHVGGADVLEADNYGDMFEIAIRGMDKLTQRHGIEYEVGTSADILYEVSGSSFDWVKGEANVPIVYLIELRDDGDFGFLLPPELIVDNNEEVMDALVEMDKVARRLGYWSNGNTLTTNLIMIALALMFVL